MYFQSVEINNYGSIIFFKYSFRFNEKKNPVPLVLIGENGSGKTLVLSNLVDSLIEVKRRTFHNNLLEVNENNYFKIGSKNYIRNNTNTSRTVIKIDGLGQEIVYTDIMSYDVLKIKEDTFVLPNDIKNKSDFNEGGYYKKVEGQLKEQEYQNFINLFFPADRFYLPLWYNHDNYKRIEYTKPVIKGKPKTNMIKADILSNIKNWLVDIYLHSEYQMINFNDAYNIPEFLRGQRAMIQIESPIQKKVTYIFNTILGNNTFHHHPIHRKNQIITLAAQSLFCKDIDQLSEGQMSLFAIALSILKEWDIEHDDFSFEEIIGTVIIDEADLGLHIDFAHDAFPRMMQLFPNIQFVITTHSPFMVAGLLNAYGDDIDIISMPDGIKITDVELFEEMKKAREVFNAGIEKHRNEINNLKAQIEELNALKDQVIIYTEGETDKILLEKAQVKLGITDLQISIQPASSGGSNRSDSAIRTLLSAIQNNPSASEKFVIGMFDRDSKTKLKDINGKEIELNNVEYIKMGKHLYAFALPIPHDRPEIEQISIEHFFTDEEIKTPNEEGQRLFLGNEFYENGNHRVDSRFNYMNARTCYKTIKIIEHENKAYVTNWKGEGDFSLSKQRFAEAIRDDRENFSTFDFSEFNKIFKVIKDIIADAHTTTEGE